MEQSFFETLSFKTEDSNELLTHIKSTLLTEIARNFHANLVNADELLHIPYVLCLVAEMTSFRIARTTSVMSKTGAYKVWETSETARKTVEEEVGRQVEEELPNIRQSAQMRVRGLFEERLLGKPMRALILATLTSIWTSFECLSKDTWIALVNAHPRELGQRAIQGLADASSNEGITNKSISLGILAKYNFDLHSCLGDVLAPKLDFTSISGIRQAYTAVLGRTAELQNIFENTDLVELEATRHMIVHRSGIIDADFRKRTTSQLSIGARFEPDSAMFSRLSNAALMSGWSLLQCVDTWLQNNPT